LFSGNADWYVLDENLNRRVRLEEEMLEEISAAMEANEDQYVEIEEGKNLQGGLISSFGNTYTVELQVLMCVTN
jgi:hypothetical protein